MSESTVVDRAQKCASDLVFERWGKSAGCEIEQGGDTTGQASSSCLILQISTTRMSDSCDKGIGSATVENL